MAPVDPYLLYSEHFGPLNPGMSTGKEKQVPQVQVPFNISMLCILGMAKIVRKET